ncbi:thioesterase family protein [Microbacterium karelineae]|uniref:thioesterase family protein n=1 Tax=Microbacterium karelineae TaxID=2654283 RepID=UPI0012EA04A2|nr:thioesterase family protein [Microbacterium karelineae]
MTTDSTEPRVPDLETLLGLDAPSSFSIPTSVWGYGGLHGGLAMSVAAAAAQRALPGYVLRSVTGQLYRPIRESFALDVRRTHAGRRVAMFEATITDRARPCATITSILGTSAGLAAVGDQTRNRAPIPPTVHPPFDHAEKHWTIPVAVLQDVEVRLVDTAAADSPDDRSSLMAWVRLKAQSAPPSVASLAFFLDVLPPSHTAFMERGTPVPTVEFSAHFAGPAPATEWVLVRARSTREVDDGWGSETIDIWDELGTHLASARQLRLPVPGAAP